MLKDKIRTDISEGTATRTSSISFSEVVAADEEAAANSILSSISVVGITADANNSRRKSYLRTPM